MTLTYDMVMDGRTTRCNWRRAECEAWGVGYPPPPGFPNRLYPQPFDEVRLIPCTRGMVAVVDAADYDEVADFIWMSMSGSRPGRSEYFQPLRGYADGGKRSVISLGRHLMRPVEGMEVDHINGDTFDNRRVNLRVCTHNENVINRSKFINGSSSFKGVRPRDGRFRANIQVRGKRIDLGSFGNEIDAALAYNKAAREYHGKFARLNDIDRDAA